MRTIVAIILFCVGLLHLLPAGGVYSAEVLSRLYGIPVLEGDLLLLMRHRALLFGVLGGLMLASIFLRSLRPAAILTLVASMLGFVILVALQGGPEGRLSGVFFADLAALVLLLLAAFIEWRVPRSNSRH